MSKKIISTISLLAAVSVVAFSGNANAGGLNITGLTPYVSGSGQYLFSQDDNVKYRDGDSAKFNYKDGYGLNLAVGAKIENVRAEIEFGYLKSDVKSVDNEPTTGVGTTVYTYMANGYYDFKNSSPITPYLGAGLGVAHGRFAYPGNAYTDNTFAYQAMAGVGYEINKNNTIYTGYRFTGTNDFNLEVSKVSYQRNAVEVGYRYSF